MKTKSQIEFERIQRNFKAKITRLEKKGYIFDDDIRNKKQTKYKDINPSTAAKMKREMSGFKSEVGKRVGKTGGASGFTTPSGYIISEPGVFEHYKKESRKERKEMSLILEERQQEWANGLAEGKISRDDYTGIGNFLKGINHTFKEISGEELAYKSRLYEMSLFFQNLDLDSMVNVIKWLDENAKGMLGQIYGSDDLYDLDAMLSYSGLEAFEEILRQYGFVPTRDIHPDIKLMEGETYLFADINVKYTYNKVKGW